MPVATDNKNKEGRIRYRIQPIVNYKYFIFTNSL